VLEACTCSPGGVRDSRRRLVGHPMWTAAGQASSSTYMTVFAVSRVVIHTPVSQLRMVPNFIFDESALTSMPALQGSPGASVMSGTKASVCRAVQCRGRPSVGRMNAFGACSG
jgi:hypothetical protein